MNDIRDSEFKDTEAVKKLIRKYNNGVLFLSLGIFILIAASIVYLLITGETTNAKLIPSLIVAVIGLILIFLGTYRIGKLKETPKKYTVPAIEYAKLQKAEISKIFTRDLIIGILLIVLTPIIYYFLFKRASFIPESMATYITAILILMIDIAIFLISYSKGRKDAYKLFE